MLTTPVLFRAALWALTSLSALAGCGKTGQELVQYDLYAVGAGTMTDAKEWHVELEHARIGVGPIYFCATEAASISLCPTAVNEFADTAAFDALRAEPQLLGKISGTSGEIRSVTLDFAYTWLTTQRTPTPTSSAPDGHSAVFVGLATKDAIKLHFILRVDIKPTYAGTLAVQGTRVQASLVEGQPPARLTLRLDASSLFSDVDFEEIAALSGDPIEVPSTSRVYSAVLTAMTTTGLPTFTWTSPSE